MSQFNRLNGQSEVGTIRQEREPARKTTATAYQRILQTVVAALNEGRVAEAVASFDDDFKFTDHALNLEFEDKKRLSEFFQKARDFFPDAVVTTESVFECGDDIVAVWKLTATMVEPSFWGVIRHSPISLRGISILHIENEKITRWSDYYDNLTSRRGGLAAFFHEWIEY